jgi:hypothetical protein
VVDVLNASFSGAHISAVEAQVAHAGTHNAAYQVSRILVGLPILLSLCMQRPPQTMAAVDNAAYMHASAGNVIQSYWNAAASHSMLTKIQAVL